LKYRAVLIGAVAPTGLWTCGVLNGRAALQDGYNYFRRAPGLARNSTRQRGESVRHQTEGLATSSGNTSFFTEGTRKWFGPHATARRACL
jgi:hypothetical protein